MSHASAAGLSAHPLRPLEVAGVIAERFVTVAALRCSSVEGQGKII